MSNQPDDPVERSILIQLGQLAQGSNPWGQRPSDSDRVRAGQEYMALKERQAARVVEAQQREAEAERLAHEQKLAEEKQRHDQEMEEERVNQEARRMMIEAQNKSRELDIEEERVQVAKAEVVVRAIEAAAKNPEVAELLLVAKAMSERLIEDKQKS